MTSPYRDADAVLCSFALRTRLPWGEAYGVVGLALVFAFLFLPFYGPLALTILAIGLAVPLVVVPQLRRYRVAGGRGELRIFRDHVEVPHPFQDEPVRLTLNELQVDVVARHVWINGVSFGETRVLVLWNGDAKRALSSTLFAVEADAQHAYVAILKARRGELELETLEALPEHRDEYDDRLDRELDELDRNGS